LIIDCEGQLMLVDFGAANEFTSEATGTLVGKHSYMPLEQIRGKAEPRSDLYALGCVLFWLLTGKEAEPLSVCRPREVCADISEQFDAIVEKLTAQEPEGRFLSAKDLMDCLQQLNLPREVLHRA
jgi:serine/threonine protein kinase